MPKGTPKIVEELQTSIRTLTELVSGLNDRLSRLEKPEETQEEPEPIKEPEEEKSYPVPSEYVDIVQNVLNPRFSVKVIPANDSPTFQFIVSVPKEYSNAPPAHWDMYRCDERVRVISYAEGSLGVREFVEKVYNNFDSETRTRITTDRLNT